MRSKCYRCGDKATAVIRWDAYTTTDPVCRKHANQSLRWATVIKRTAG